MNPAMAFEVLRNMLIIMELDREKERKKKREKAKNSMCKTHGASSGNCFKAQGGHHRWRISLSFAIDNRA